jgi:hypothetical protein
LRAFRIDVLKKEVEMLEKQEGRQEGRGTQWRWWM